MNEESNQWLVTPITNKSTIINTTTTKRKSQTNIDNINYINQDMNKNNNQNDVINNDNLSLIENHQHQFEEQKTHQLSQLCLMCRQNYCIYNECCHHNNLLSSNISSTITPTTKTNINMTNTTIIHQQLIDNNCDCSNNLKSPLIFDPNERLTVLVGSSTNRKYSKIRNYCKSSYCCCCYCYKCNSSISPINTNHQNLINKNNNNNKNYNSNYETKLIQPTIEMLLMWFGSEKFKLNSHNNMKKTNKFRTFNKYKTKFLHILCILYLVNFTLLSVMCSAATTDTINSNSLRLNDRSSAATLQSRRNGVVCTSRDIRNHASQLENLRNCTVIEGFLTINLMEASSVDFENASFPYLTEITEFLFVYRVKGLKSLGPLFPNLSVIRGKQLFEGYALILYENFNLVDIGLKSLTLIKRGAVRIEKNPELCFLNTVNWTEIVDSKEGNYFSENKDVRDCPSCPLSNQTALDSKKEPNCWNFKDNQKICPPECENNCNDNLQCCNKNCIGNCDINNINICHSCRDFVDGEFECRKNCPRNKYKFSDRSCITLAGCHQKTNYENNTNVPAAIFEDTCIPHCPDGYQRASPPTNNTCVLCRGGYCYKQCEGGSVDSLADAKKYRGCSHIGEKGLIINLRLGGKHLMYELENAFSSIRVIDTFLRVIRSFSLTSLSFFKNLQIINGNGIKDSGNFSLYVLENNNLQHIWGENQTVKIAQGRVFFHFNEKLCYKDILNLLKNMADNAPFADTEVPKSSNGNRGACDKKILNTRITKINSKNAIVEITNPIMYEDDRVLIAYQYYLIEAPFRNVTKHDYRNPCDTEGWIVFDDTKKLTSHSFTRLKPFTQYAFYVKTETTADNENGESEIDYFTTLTDTPMPIRNFRIIYKNLSSELLIKWLPPARPNGNIVLYKIKAELMQVEPIPKISYCKNTYKRDELYKSSGYENNKITISNNKNANNDNCRDCFCEKESQHPSHKQLQQSSYYDYENSIVFEDAIQNFVFVKKSANALANLSNDIIEDFDDIKITRRPKRATFITNNLLNNHSLLPSTSSPTPTPTPITTTLKSQTISLFGNDIIEYFPDKNAIDPNEKISVYDHNQFYKYFYVDVNSSVNEFLLTNLKYFSKYYITVVACHDGKIDKNCSDISFREAETNRFEGADNVTNVEAYLDSTTNRTSSIKVTWTPPPEPNGIILKYNIQYYKVGDSIRDKCIATSELIKNNDTTMNVNGSIIKPIITLQDLPTGNYELRVQAITQAGEGYWSDPPFSIYVPPTQMSWQAITGICIGLLFFLLSIAFTVWYFRKKYLAQTPDLKLFTSVNPEYISMQYTPDEWELPRDKIIQYQELGQGSFGMVYQGVVTLNRTQEVTPCAIKTVNENATDRERINFLNEASVMKEFNTHHVVKLLGVVSRGQPTLVVMELMQKGDLKAYLRQHRPDVENIREGEPPPQPPTLKQLIQMALEIADGMAYLSAKKFVHRDLAARNCMVAEDLTVKIGDFGMTRDIYETDYYRKGTKGLLPVRWMSPESLKDGVFSSASDVFSFGVVLWEMATLASQPYQGLSNDQVLRYVIEGGIMESPQNVNCPNQFYNLMSKCWQFKPIARPTFMDIIQYLLENADEDTDKKFRSVSFYYTPAGQEALEQLQPSNDTDDATVPLRMGEYDYKISVEDTLSHGHHHDSNLVEEDQAHSPYSLGSRILINSANNSHNSNPSSHQQSSFLAAAMQSEKPKSTPTQQQHYHTKYQMEDGNGGGGKRSGEPYRIPMSMTGADATTSTNINYGSVIGDNGSNSSTNYPSTSSQFRLPPNISDAINESPRLKNQKFQFNSQSGDGVGVGGGLTATEPFYRRLGRGIWNLRKLRNNRNNNDAINQQIADNNSSSSLRRRGNGNGNGTGTNGTTTKDDKKVSGASSLVNTNDNNGQQQQHSNSGGSSGKKFLSSLTPSHTSQNPNYQILNESNISTGSLLDNNNPLKVIDQPSCTTQSINNPIWERNIINQKGKNKMDDDNDGEDDGNNDNEDCSNLSLIDEQCKKNNDKYKKPSSYLKNSNSNNSNINIKNNNSSGGDSSNVVSGDTTQQQQSKLKSQTPYQLKEQWLKQHLAAGGNISDQPPNGFIGRFFESTSSNDDLPISIQKKTSKPLQQQQQQQQQYWIGKKSPTHSKNIDRSYTQDSSSPLLEMSTFDTSKDFDEIEQELIPPTTTGNILKEEIIKKQ